MPNFWQLATCHNTNSQNSTIFFGHVDFWAKIFLILYPPLENSTTRTTIMSGRTRNTNQRSSSRRVEQTTTPMMDLSKTVEPGLEDSTTPVSLPEEPNVDEYGNKLVYLGYRKEDYFCPEGYVLDIYGYCRYICVFVYVLPSSAHSVDRQKCHILKLLEQIFSF